MDDPADPPSETEPVSPSAGALPTSVSPSAAGRSPAVSPSAEPLGQPDAPPTRRRFLRGAGLVGAGMAVGVAGFAEVAHIAERKLPLLPGAASGTVGDRSTGGGRGQLRVTWEVRTDAKLIALTFDDGPRPEWTNLVLETLELYETPATFFLVGRRVLKYPYVLRGRMDRHDVGNHTWDHLDLARRSQTEAYDDLKQAHDAIIEITGKTPRLFRPPVRPLRRQFGSRRGPARLRACAVVAADGGVGLSRRPRRARAPHHQPGRARARSCSRTTSRRPVVTTGRSRSTASPR